MKQLFAERDSPSEREMLQRSSSRQKIDSLRSMSRNRKRRYFSTTRRGCSSVSNLFGLRIHKRTTRCKARKEPITTHKTGRWIQFFGTLVNARSDKLGLYIVIKITPQSTAHTLGIGPAVEDVGSTLE